MPDDVIQDAAVADSSTATTTAAEPSSQATTQPAPIGDQVPFHQHPRWQQLMQERNTERQQMAQLRQQLAEYQRSQQQAGRPQPTAEQQEALRALRELQGLDPESAKQQERLDRLERALQGMVQQQQTALTTQGRSQLQQMASESGLPTDPKALAVIENAVTVYLADNPEAVARFRNHDLSVIKDAFKEFNDTFLGKLRRESAVGLVEKKTAAAAIPTPTKNGGPPGAAAPPKLTATNGREVRDGLRARFMEKLMGGAQE